LLAACGSPPIRVELWDGVAISAGNGAAVGTIAIRDRSTLWQLIVNPNIGFWRRVQQGAILVRGALIEILSAIENGLASVRSSSFLQRFVYRRTEVGPHYDPPPARDSVHPPLRHRKRILPPLARRTDAVPHCAYYPDPSCDLDAAQLAKLDHVLPETSFATRRARSRSGVAAGAGWPCTWPSDTGAAVRAFNLSHEQIEFCHDVARQRNLTSRIEFVEDDYRNATGE